MSYASGGLIQATDFNGLATTNASNVAWVWGTGWQRTGYGQDTTLLSSVTASSTVTATQWAGFVYTVNRALGHQGQTQLGGGVGGANINMTAGETITYFANVESAVTQVNTTKNSYYAVGTTVTGSNFTSSISFPDSTSNYGFAATRTVTFAGGVDAVRYFFNGGGRIQLVLTGTNNNGTSRSGDILNLFQSWLGGSIIYDANSAARTGSGGTLNSSNTSAGYYTLTTTPTLLANVSSNSATYTYQSDWARILVNSNGTQGSTGDQGTTITFTFGCGVAAQTNSNFNDAINVTLTSRVDIIPPESGFLANTWGVIGVT